MIGDVGDRKGVDTCAENPKLTRQSEQKEMEMVGGREWCKEEDKE